MPSYAHLAIELKCPFCNANVTDMVWFQWGYCRGYAPRERHTYKLNDPIYWKPCKDGSILPWTYFDGTEGNIGDPAVRDLIVRDTSPLFQIGTTCEACSHRLEGAAIEIRAGIIRRAWIYSPSEFDSGTDIYIFEEGAALRPMPEWNDHPMATSTDC